jgi:hypothetical protein
MGRGNHGNGLLADVDMKGEAGFINVGEPVDDKVFPFVADIKIHAWIAAFFQLHVDGSGHNIPECQILQGMVRRHEPIPFFVQKDSPFAPYGFGDQKVLGQRMVQGSGVELDEFHVGHFNARPKAHGNAVPGGNVRVAGIAVHFAGTTGTKDGNSRQEGEDGP